MQVLGLNSLLCTQHSKQPLVAMKVDWNWKKKQQEANLSENEMFFKIFT